MTLTKPLQTLLLLFALSPLAHAGAAGLEATLDRTRIVEGETVLLTLTAPGDSWGVPDLGALETDFEVTNQGQSTNMTIVNGQASSTRQWQFLLAPKRTGQLAVPALKVGQLASQPLTLEVLPAARAEELGQTLPVMVEAEVDKEAPYVQGQVIYRVRVLVRTDLSRATLDDPGGDDLIVERLGDDHRYEAVRGGQRYRVIERRYALFPQHSGPITIAPPVLNGSVPDSSGARQGPGDRLFGGTAKDRFDRLFGRDPFEDMDSLFQRTRPIQVRGPELTLAVRPKPADAVDPWVPAESLQLSEAWTPEPRELRVGEPITRTVAITAQGLTAAQLPDLAGEAPQGLKVYPDQPRTETRAEGDTVVSVKEIKLAMVPSAEGELTLPEVRLAWWDTTADRERVAVLPARVVEVLPPRAGAEPRSSSPLPDTVQSRPVERGPALPSPAPSPATPDASAAEEASWDVSPGGPWPWISIGLALAWLITLGLWLRERASRSAARVRREQVRAQSPSPSLFSAKSVIRRACEANDPRAARDALLAWAAVRWPEDPPGRLETLARRLDASATEALIQLDRSLYAGAGEGWDGRGAWERLGPALARAPDRPDEGASALPPLYPSGA